MKQNVIIMTFLISMSFVAVAHAAALRTVALTGQSAPGTANGVNYESFGALRHPQHSTRYLAPVLNDAGQVAFRANLTGGGVDSTNHQGIWSEGSGSLALVARTGSQAPGAPSGVNFRIDPALELFSPALNNAGQTAFYGSLTDGTLGFWSEGSGSLALVARSGQQAPGASSGTNFAFGLLFDEFLDDPVLNDAGQTAFRSALAGSGVNSTNNFGMWMESSGTATLLARRGSPAPGTPSGTNFDVSFETGLNNAGMTVFFSFLAGSGVNSSNERSIWSDASGSLTMLARTGSQAPGLPDGVNFTALYNTVAINSAGHIAFVAGLSDENSALMQDSIWSDRSGSLSLVARRGTHAPGAPDGVDFELFGHWLMLNDAGQIVFNGRLTGDGVDESNNRSIWFEDSGNMTMVARSANQAPGTPSGVVYSSFTDFGLATLNNAGQVAFGAVLTGNGVDSTNNRGIWATDPTGAVQLITRTGDSLEVAPGDFRTISDLVFVNGTGNANGWPSAFNNLGQLVFWASFTDGSEGVFVSNTVAHLPGDFNNDGTVDAADYVVWRKNFSDDPSKYGQWRANFGRTLFAGSGLALPSAEPLSAAVPEPATIVLLALAAGMCVKRRRLHRFRLITHPRMIHTKNRPFSTGRSFPATHTFDGTPIVS